MHLLPHPQVFEITLTRGYDEAAFRDDLRKLYTLVGAENKRAVFLFTDAHVADESFLELINNMLTSGVCAWVGLRLLGEMVLSNCTRQAWVHPLPQRQGLWQSATLLV